VIRRPAASAQVKPVMSGRRPGVRHWADSEPVMAGGVAARADCAEAEMSLEGVSGQLSPKGMILARPGVWHHKLTRAYREETMLCSPR
jgi:hypothetical protein